MPILLTADIGNTNTDLGLFDSGRLLGRCRVRTRDGADPGVLAAAANRLVASLRLVERVRAGAVASVVADRARAAATALSPLCAGRCECAEASWDLGIAVDYDTPLSVGIDRLLAAAAAFALQAGRGGAVVADAGTALTVDAVDRDGVFRGGMIMPGLHLALGALHAGTSLLPQVEVQGDIPLLGRSTPACMLAGAVQGAAAMLSELFRRIPAHLGQPLAPYLTGGDGPLLAPLVRPPARLEPALVLEGLAAALGRRAAARP